MPHTHDVVISDAVGSVNYKARYYFHVHNAALTAHAEGYCVVLFSHRHSAHGHVKTIITSKDYSMRQ